MFFVDKWYVPRHDMISIFLCFCDRFFHFGHTIGDGEGVADCFSAKLNNGGVSLRIYCLC